MNFEDNLQIRERISKEGEVDNGRSDVRAEARRGGGHSTRSTSLPNVKEGVDRL